MNTNLTLGDILITLGVGVVATLVAGPFWRRCVAGWIWLSDAWARRSVTSAQKRLQRLEAELARHMAMLSDPAVYTGRCIGKLSVALVRMIFAVMFLLSSIAVLTLLSVVNIAHQMGLTTSSGAPAPPVDSFERWIPAGGSQ